MRQYVVFIFKNPHGAETRFFLSYRVMALVEREASYLTLKDISRKCLMPSTHAYSGRQVDRIIATGKLERSVQVISSNMN